MVRDDPGREYVWERTDPSDRLSVRIGTLLLALALAGGGLFVAKRFVGWGSPRSSDPAPMAISSPGPSEGPSPLPTRIARTRARRAPSPSAALWRRLEPGERVAAVVYRTGRRTRALAVVDASGKANVCVHGTDLLEVGDVANGSILYLDTDLFVVPATCDAEPRILARAADVLGDVEPDNWQGIRCPSVAPDGVRVTFSTYTYCCEGATWITDLEGKTLRRVARVSSCGWVDDDHVIADPRAAQDPFAIDVSSGDRRLFRNPTMWSGWVSHDRSSAMYGVGGTQGERLRWFTWTVRAGERPLDLSMRSSSSCVEGAGSPAGDVWGSGRPGTRTTPWEPGGRRLLVGADGELMVLSRSGATVEYLPSSLCGWETTLGWFGRRQLIVGDAHDSTVSIYDMASRRTAKVDLPGARTPRRGRLPHVTVMTIRRLAIREGGPATYLDPSDFVRWEEAAAGFTVALPPSWRIEKCRTCDSVVRLIFGREAFRGCQVDPQALSIGFTDTSPERAQRRMMRQRKVQDHCDWERESCAELQRETSMIIDGQEFRFLEIQFYESYGVYAFGSAGAQTAVLQLPNSLHVNDPSMQALLESLRFV